jgi:hypothetical protein
LLDAVREVSNRIDERFAELVALNDDRTAELSSRIDEIDPSRLRDGPFDQFVNSIARNALLLWLTDGGGGAMVLYGIVRVLVGFYRFTVL